MRFYLDSNILITYIKSEFGGVTKAHSIRTKDFLVKTSVDKDVLILSDLTFEEIEKITYLTRKEIKELLNKFQIRHEETETTKETIEKSKQVKKDCRIHFPDNIHVALAIQSKADYMITWNQKDFNKTKKLIENKTP